MSETSTEVVYDVLVTEDIEVRHDASGVLLKIEKEVLFSGQVSAVDEQAAEIKAIREVKKADSDPNMMEVKIRPFCDSEE